MTNSPLFIAFLWHMHQPFYRDPFTGIYRLPWVRLHGTKDYLDMASILEDYPDIKQTFNLVPSLIEQIIDYAENNAVDTYLEVTMKRASDLTEKDRIFIVENFFLANWENMVRPFPRYYELLQKRGMKYSKGDIYRVAKYFTEGDLLDLQVLFNLAWIDPMLRDRDPFLSGLVKKGRGYSEEDKSLLIEKQLSILKEIIPKYRELSNRGQIEISVSPYYHPILPLLWDTNIARVSDPGIKLPKRRFSHPEDARDQIRMAIGYFEKVFGYRPSGMWPSEGSVSEDVVKAIHSEGIQWTATDEEILSRSSGINLRAASGIVTQPSMLYSAYDFSGISIIFRDRRLSDLIGFAYSGWQPRRAAEDLIGRLLHIHDSLTDDEPHLVSIILDGENAWEYYKNDGHDFLRYLYEGISRNERIKTTTVSGYLKQHPERKRLDRIHPGSWINGNFNIWIGHEEDNTAWDYLTETREDLEGFRKLNPEKGVDSALKALYVAEGSDWNWWYGDEHSTEKEVEFDELFRSNLMKVYKEIGRDVPPHLYVPVLKKDRAVTPTMEIKGFIHPRIDGVMTGYFEWYQAAYIDVEKSGGSMHISESLISRIYYGFNEDSLFIRVDPKGNFADFPEDTTISLEIIRPSPFRVDVPLRKNTAARLFSRSDGEWHEVREVADVAVGDILECAIPFKDINAKEHDELNLFLFIRRGDDEIERCPLRGYITITVPTADFESMMWY